METDVDKIRGDDFMVGISTRSICDAEGNVVSSQDGKNLVTDPGRVPDLQGMALGWVQRLTKILKSFFIKRKTGWQLKEKRSQFFSQAGGSRIESLQRLLWFF